MVVSTWPAMQTRETKVTYLGGQSPQRLSMSRVPFVVVPGTRRREHRIARSAFVDWALVILGPHVVDETMLRGTSLSTHFAPKVVLRLEMKLERICSPETIPAELTGWPMCFFCHVPDELFMVEELGTTCVTIMQRAVNNALRSTTRRRHDDRVSKDKRQDKLVDEEIGSA